MKIVYYYHIPKCGGTTISRQLQELSRTLGGEYHNFNFPMRNSGFLRIVINNYKLRRFLRNINNKTNDFKFIHHHHGFYGLGEIYNALLQQKRKAARTGNEFHLFTCIREPLSFQVSRINYLRNSCGRPDLSFDDFCRNPLYQNVMGKYCLWNHHKRYKNRDLDKQPLMKTIGIIDKVFLLEDLKSLYHWLEEIVGTPVKSPAKSLKVGEKLLTPTERQLETLGQVNAIDQFFYDIVSNNADQI